MWEFFYYTKCIKTEAKHVKITQFLISHQPSLMKIQTNHKISRDKTGPWRRGQR